MGDQTISNAPLDRRFLLGALGGVAGAAALSQLAQAGPLNPPAGPVTPTGHTTDELWNKIARTDVGLAEPRIPVQSLPGSATASHVISQPGSYYLTGDINGAAGRNAIAIGASDVELDLRGFTIRGVAGALAAVFASGAIERVVVRDGRIQGWPSPFPIEAAVDLTTASSVLASCLVVDGSGRAGISAGPNSVVVDCVGISNGFSSFFMRPNALVKNSASFRSGGLDGFHGGVFAFFGGTVIENFVSMGDRVGIRIEDTGLITNCRIINATGWAMRVGSRVHIRDSQVIGGGGGIECFQQSVVELNSFSGCSGPAISVSANGSKVRIESNKIVECNGGIVLGTPTSNCFVARNSVQVFAGTPYTIPPGNSFGPIVNVAGVGAITAVANANHPWANFIH